MAKKAYGKRRKGISIAAGLVALSMVAQVAPATVLPVQPAVASAQEAAADATTKGAPIDADGIASKVVTKMDQLGDYKWVNDQRKNNHGGMIGGRLFSSTTGTFSTVGANPEVLTGYTVYSQWMDEDNAVSPVYKAKTADIEGSAGSGKGAFVFHYPNWTDGNGKVHEFNGKPYKVRIRMWIAPDQVGPAGGKLITLRQAPGIQSGFMNQSDGGAGMWSNVPQSFQYTGIFVYELPSDLMYAKESDKDRYHVDTLGVPTGSSFNAADRSAVTGRIWWETGRTESGTITFPVSTGENFVGKDEARVTTSILTNEGVQAFEKLKNLDRPERIKKQQELLKNNPKYIAETVVAYTNDKGEYYARFNKKNFDRRYLYQFVEMKDKDGNWKVQPAYSSYLAPMFGQPNETMNIPQLWQDVRHTWANMHFAIVREPEQAQLAIDEDVVYATNKVTPKISALVNEGETAYVQWVNSKGEKIKRDGTPGEEQIPVKGGHNIANPFADATLTVPAQDKLKADDTYTAQLWVNGALVAADSVSVALNGPDSDAAKYAPKYETTYIQPVEGKDLSLGCGVPSADDPQNLTRKGSSCFQLRGVGRIANIADIPQDKIKSIKVTGVEDTPENPKLFGDISNGWAGDRMGGNKLWDPVVSAYLPIGNTAIQQRNLNDLRERLGMEGDRIESDIVVGINTEDAKIGQYQDVNVEVTYADGTKDNIVARFVYGTKDDDPNVDKPTLADQREVSYPDTPATAGKKASAKPELKKADGSTFPAEEVTKYEKGASPEGVSDDEWSVDPATGEVTYTPKEGTQPGKVTFPVKVTYKDGSSENTTATFTVKEDKTTRSDVDYRKKTTVPQGGTETVPAPTDANGKALEGATYELKEPDTYDWVTLNKDGSLTVKPTADTPKGTYYIPVMVKETNGADQLIYAEVEVTDPVAKTDTPRVDPIHAGATKITGTAKEGETVKVTIPGVKDPVEVVAGKDGAFSVDVPKDVTLKEDDKVTTTAKAKDKDWSDPVETTVGKADKDTYSPTYKGTEGKAGETTTVPLEPSDPALPKGTKFAIDKTFKVPEGWTVEVNETTGEVSVTPKADLTADTPVEIPVVVTYPDGSQETVKLNFTGKKKEDTPPVVDKTDTDKDGLTDTQEKNGKNDEGKDYNRVTYTDKDGKEQTRPEDFKTDPTKADTDGDGLNDKQELTGKDADGKDYPAIVITKKDGSKETITGPFITHPKVADTDGDGINDGDELKNGTDPTRFDTDGDGIGDKYDSNPTDATKGNDWETTVTPGQDNTISKKPVDKGTTIEVTDGKDKATAGIDENGNVIVTPNENAKAGDKIEVTVTYPDGSKEVVTVTVKAPDLKDTTGKPGAKEIPVDNKGGKLPDGATAVVTEGSGTAKVDKDGNVIVTPNPDANPGDKIKVTVTYPDADGNTVTKEITVTVGGEKDINKSGFDTSVQPGPGESKVIPTKDGKPLTNGTTAKVIDGPGTAKVEGGKLIVTPNKDAKPGKKIVVEVTYPDGSKELITITVGIDLGLCVGASAASAIPLLLLTPIALGLAMDNPQVKDMTAGFGKTLEDINTGIQKTLGIYNPALAQQFKVQVAPHLQNLALAAGFIASIGLLAGVAASQCTVPTEGGLSSGKDSAPKPTASAQPTTEVPVSEAPTSEAPTPESPAPESPAPEA